MKYRVHFEASAAIGIEYEVEASSSEEATRLAARKFGGGGGVLGAQMHRMVAGLMDPTTDAIKGFNEGLREIGELVYPCTHATVALSDETGFEIVDVYDPDNQEGDKTNDTGGN